MHYKRKASNCNAIFKLIICTGIFLFSRYINSFAQESTNYFFRHITQQDGLAHNAVYGITPQADILVQNAGYAIAYTATLLIIATVIFSRRQF